MTLRTNFTDKTIISAVQGADNLTQAARELTKLGHGKVSRQARPHEQRCGC